MASLTCLCPTHLLLLHHRGSALPTGSGRYFNHSSSLDRVLSSLNRPKAGFSATQHELASPGNLEFEAPLKIVKYPDPKLRAINKRIGTFDDNIKKLVHEMFDVMYKTDGIGLSAPQVGINVQLMVFNPVGERGEGEEIVLINPRVSKYSKKQTLYNEGCLSFPGICADVKRPDSVKIDACDVNGTRFSVNLSGLPARVFQHEFDHLQGILFFERMTEEVLDSIRGQLQPGNKFPHFFLDFIKDRFASSHIFLCSRQMMLEPALEMKYEEMTGFPSPEKIENHRRRKAAVGFGKL